MAPLSYSSKNYLNRINSVRKAHCQIVKPHIIKNCSSRFFQNCFCYTAEPLCLHTKTPCYTKTAIDATLLDYYACHADFCHPSVKVAPKIKAQTAKIKFN